MYKLLLIPLLSLSLSYAEKSYSFVGVQTSLIDDKESSSSSYGLKYGLQRGMWRSAFNLDYSKQDETSLSSLLLQVDRGILQQSAKNIPLKPHVGFSVGLLQQDTDVKDRGYSMGVNGGVTYILNDAIDLDLSYRYLRTSSMNHLDSLQFINFSLHYFY